MARPHLEPLEDRAVPADFTLQILHASDLEGGVNAIGAAPNFAAILDNLEDTHANSITLSAGDNYIPGPFFNAAGDPSVQATLRSVYESYFGLAPGTLSNLRTSEGRIDVTIMNVVGFDASALGNHEFDAGTTVASTILGANVSSGTAPNQVQWYGAQFPYLSANLDFSGDGALNPLFTNSVLNSTAFRTTPANVTATPRLKLAPATVIERGGERIGVVGATTPILEQISSPGATRVKNPGAGTNDMAALASILQPTIDLLRADGVNKIILVSHLQQIQLEQDLAPRLAGVDVIIAGGSDTLLADGTDVLHPGDVPAGPYPVQARGLDGAPVVIVSTDGEYSYVGRLVVTFDENGVLRTDVMGNALVDPNVSGVFNTSDATVQALWSDLTTPFATGTKGALVRQLVTAVQNVVTTKDGTIFGKSSVYLNGLRADIRTQETNLGNLTADANLAAARAADSATVISFKNGGGIRDSIGSIDGLTGERGPTLANPLSGKQAGEISLLDIENSLRFNNSLSLLTLSAADLELILEHGVADTGPGRTPGRFPQIGGVRFTFDSTLPVGQRVLSAAVVDGAGNVVDTILANGAVVGDPNRLFRVVTLSFLASGGDGYPFATLAEPGSRVDLTAPGGGPLGEQKALADFLTANFATTPFGQSDTPSRLDRRVFDVARDRVVSAPAGGSNLTLRRSGANVELVSGATVLSSVPANVVRSFTVNGTAAADKLTIDFASGGAFALADGAFFHAGAGRDILTVLGGGGDDSFGLNGGVVTLGAFAAAHTGVERFELDGGAGNDRLSAVAGRVEVALVGGPGDDVFALALTSSRVTIHDASGSDTLDLSDSLRGVVLNLGLSAGQPQAIGGNVLAITGAIETAIGSDFADVLFGSAGPDRILGGGGSDVIFGRGGDDELDGGDGNDTLLGEGGDDLLLGGAGSDLLLGGAGRDVAIGGLGRDLLLGEAGDDLLIGGTVSFAADRAALAAVRAEWSSARDYETRVKNLRDGSGSADRVNGAFFLTLGGTVTSDGSPDLLFGGGDFDWFFGTAVDRRANEFAG